MLTFYPSRGSKRHWIPDPDPQHWSADKEPNGSGSSLRQNADSTSVFRVPGMETNADPKNMFTIYFKLPNKTRYTYLHRIFAAFASNFFTFVSAACKTAFTPGKGAG